MTFAVHLRLSLVKNKSRENPALFRMLSDPTHKHKRGREVCGAEEGGRAEGRPGGKKLVGRFSADVGLGTVSNGPGLESAA